MRENNVKKLSSIIYEHYNKYGEPIKDWAVRAGCSSIRSLSEYLGSEYNNVRNTLKELQAVINDIVDDIYKENMNGTPTIIYDNVLGQLNWTIPKNKKNTVFFQFLKNKRPIRAYKWAEIENDFLRILDNNINDSELTLIKYINDLNWEEGSILDDLECSLSKDLFEFINSNVHTYVEVGNKIYASDIAKIVEMYDKLKVYKSIKKMIENERIPDWITSFWNGAGIELERGYNSNSFQNVNLNNNSIIDIFEMACIQTITSYFTENIDQKDYNIWVNVTAEENIMPADITKTNIEELEWDIIFDNILYFSNTQKKNTGIMTKLLQNEAKKYLDTLLFLVHNEEVPELEIQRNYIGYYCNSLLNYYTEKIKRTDKPSHWTTDDYRYYLQKEAIAPFISSLYRYILFPSKAHYTKFSEEWNNLNQRFEDKIAIKKIETENLFLMNHKNYTLKDIDVSQKVIDTKKEITIKDQYDYYLNDDNNKRDIKKTLLFDISKCLLAEIRNANYENYRADIRNYYIFGNKINKKIDKTNNSVLKMKNISTKEKLKILFMNLEQYPTTIKSVFKYEILYDKDYRCLIHSGEAGIESFIENVYEIIGKDKEGKPIRKMVDDDYKLNGKFYEQTKAFLNLPKMTLLHEETLDVLGNGCSRILDNCEHFVNYSLAMQNNPLISKDKKEGRIFELICCYPENYNLFINS